jgi:hypothetical protein
VRGVCDQMYRHKVVSVRQVTQWNLFYAVIYFELLVGNKYLRKDTHCRDCRLPDSIFCW